MSIGLDQPVQQAVIGNYPTAVPSSSIKVLHARPPGLTAYGLTMKLALPDQAPGGQRTPAPDPQSGKWEARHVRICLRVRERRDLDLGLGQGAFNAGLHALTLTRPGEFLVSDRAHPARTGPRGAYLIN